MKALAGLLVGVFVLIPQFVLAAPVQCECSRYLREVLSVNVPRGNAGTYLPNIYQGQVKEGDVVILKYGKVWHVALITAFGEVEVNPYNPTTRVPKLILAETNLVPCTPTVRAISWFDDNIIGIYRPL